MRIEIFETRRAGDSYVPDERQRVAVVEIASGKASLVIEDFRRERVLRRLFEEPLVAMGPGDTLNQPEPWSTEALRILQQDLLAYNLAARLSPP